MKPTLVFSMLLISTIFSIGVFALNNRGTDEAPVDPDNPHLGTYRAAADAHGPLSTIAYTHSRIVEVDPPIYPSVRIWDCASSTFWCENAFLSGSSSVHTSVPTKSNTKEDFPYQGRHSEDSWSDNTRDLHMGTPDISKCESWARGNSSPGNSSSAYSTAAEIPW